MRYDEIKWEDEDEEIVENMSSDEVSFEDLLASEGEQESMDLFVGMQVTGTIISIGSNVLVELDAQHTGVLDIIDIKEEDGSDKYLIGDKVTAYVANIAGSEVQLSTSLSSSQQSEQDFSMARENGLPMKGKVVAENKGGFDVTIAGKKCFCPVSQIDSRFVENKAEYIGKEFNFLIIKYSEGGRNILVSRSALLKREAELKIAELEDRLSEDLILTGTVKEVKDFGAFIDLGGIDGFLHISEMSYSRINKASEFLEKGETVRVKVLSVEEVKGRKRISLSMKAAQDDPWANISESVKEGQSFKGKVMRLESFGAFVEILPGIEGLIHVSEMSWEKRVHHPSDILNPGDEVNVRVLDVNTATQRISLSLKDQNDDPWLKASNDFASGKLVEGKVVSLKDFGAIVELAPGVTGLLPKSTLKLAYGESFKKHASPPKMIEVKVENLNLGEKKVLLGLPGIEVEDSTENDFRDYQKSQDSKKKDEKATGTFGALLAAKLKK